MIQLIESLIAVEVPNYATDIELNEGVFLVFLSYKIGIQFYLKDLELKPNNHSLIGVTPLSEEQWKEVVGSHTSSERVYCDRTPYVIPVSPKDRWNDLQRHKGLDINKKYAIIKIEK